MLKIMNVRHLLPLFIVLLAALLTACVPTVDTAADANERVEPQDESTTNAFADLLQNDTGYVDITAEQLAAAMQQKDFTLVNVHIPDQGSIPNTDLSVPFNDIDAFTAALPQKDDPIVIYCRSGGMSSQMAPLLADLGYTNLYEVDGGFNAWAAAGYELLHPQ